MFFSPDEPRMIDPRLDLIVKHVSTVHKIYLKCPTITRAHDQPVANFDGFAGEDRAFAYFDGETGF